MCHCVSHNKVPPIADRVAHHLEIISKNFRFSTRRTRILMGFIMYYLVLIVNPMGRILVRWKGFKNHLEIQCHSICNWLWLYAMCHCVYAMCHCVYAMCHCVYHITYYVMSHCVTEHIMTYYVTLQNTLRDVQRHAWMRHDVTQLHVSMCVT